jgi:hypothetical protein
MPGLYTCTRDKKQILAGPSTDLRSYSLVKLVDSFRVTNLRVGTALLTKILLRSCVGDLSGLSRDHVDAATKASPLFGVGHKRPTPLHGLVPLL